MRGRVLATYKDGKDLLVVLVLLLSESVGRRGLHEDRSRNVSLLGARETTAISELRREGQHHGSRDRERTIFEFCGVGKRVCVVDGIGLSSKLQRASGRKNDDDNLMRRPVRVGYRVRRARRIVC